MLASRLFKVDFWKISSWSFKIIDFCKDELAEAGDRFLANQATSANS
jgi:hypothetical protein